MNRTKRAFLTYEALVLAVICLLLISPLAHSETKFLPGFKPAVLKIVNLDISNFPTVNCEVAFRYYTGEEISLNGDLTLRLYEDEIPITDFTLQSSRMIATVFLIDTSGSMRGRMERVAEGVKAYLERLGPDDKVMVMEFNSWRGYTPVVQDFTNDTELIQKTIANLEPRGQTAIYDAVADASDKFYPTYRDAAKVIIVLSDGEDNNSVREWFTAISFAKEHNIRIFFVALGPEADTRTFSRICRETDGKVFTAPTEESLPDTYESISKSVRARGAVLSYQTNGNVTADGRPHYLQVGVYKGAKLWAKSSLKSYKFRILKTADQLARDEQARQALKEKKEQDAAAAAQAKEAPEKAKAAEAAETPKPDAKEGEQAKEKPAAEAEPKSEAKSEEQQKKEESKEKPKAEKKGE
ncbi:MAG TPA: vWA domain-containing protein [bacterium]|nr:vWA domain-containing protein [bacterium]